MQTPPPSATSTSKRKRPTADSAYYLSPSPTRLKTTDLPSQPLGCLDGIDPVTSLSPRTTITGRLRELDLQEQDGAIPKLDFGMGKRKNMTTSGAFAPQVLLPKNQTCSNNNIDGSGADNASGAATPPSSVHDQALSPEHPSPLHPQHHIPSALSIPETPPPPTTQLSPFTSTTTTPTLDPPIPTPDPRLNNKSPIHHSPSHQSPTSPLSTSLSTQSLWWTPPEITGHNPSDPTDDGYGINGVGFVPTPAIASARAEKRRRQVREWKEREAREARVRRGAIRRLRNRGGVNGDVRGGGEEVDEAGMGMKGKGGGEGEGKGEEDGSRRKEVRFSDVMELEVG